MEMRKVAVWRGVAHYASRSEMNHRFWERWRVGMAMILRRSMQAEVSDLLPALNRSG